MTIKHVAYRLAHDFPGGIAGLAALMDKGPQVLTNKLNPNCDTHHLTIAELEMLGDFADSNLQLADFFAKKCNAVVVSLPTDGVVGDESLLDSFMGASVKAGEFASEFAQAWGDGRISAAEFDRLNAKLYSQIASQLSLLSKIEGLVR